MASRISVAFTVALSIACAAAGCKDSGTAKKAQGSAADTAQRCERLGKTCGDSDKHASKIADGCTQALTTQPTCADKMLAAYDCYEKELCGKADKIWAVDDLRVLAERANKCAAERQALVTCVGK